MNTVLDDPTAAALDQLLHADVACAEHDELAELVKVARKVRGYLDAFDVQIAKRGRALNERDRPRPAPTPDGPPPPPDKGRDDASLIGLLLTSGMQSGKDAKATGARARVCAELPGFEAALAAGDISGTHLDVLARHLRGLSDPELIELRDREAELLRLARHEFAEGFDRAVRNLINEIRARHRPSSAADELEQQRKASKLSSWVDRDTGMHKTLVELDPLRAQELNLAVNAHLARLKQDPAWARRSYQELKVAAFMAAVNTPGNGGADTATTATTPVRVPKVIIVVDLATLVSGPHTATVAELTNGTTLPVDVIRQMLPDSDLVPVLLSGQGQPLWVGRTRRVATEAQRDALAAIYRGCARPSCDRSLDDTQAHHTHHWSAGGPTDIDLLVPVCAHDHDAIHNGGYRLTIHDNHSSITWTRPDGSTEHRGPPSRRPPPPP